MYAVLLVEDEPVALRYLKALIERKCRDFEVVATATNGKQALEYLERARPDLVITDVRMSEIDGVELASRLKDDWPDLPVVIVSGYQEFELARKVLNTGVVDYLPKPLSASILTAVLDSLRNRMDATLREVALRHLRRLVDGTKEAEAPAQQLRLAMLRSGGPPPSNLASSGDSDRWDGTVAVLGGRDRREWFFVAESSRISESEFRSFVEASERRSIPAAWTIVYATESGDVHGAVAALCTAIDGESVPGISQVVAAGKGARRRPVRNLVAESRLEKSLSSGQATAIDGALSNMVETWRTERRTYAEIVPAVRRLLEISNRSSRLEYSESEIDRMSREIVVCADSFEEILNRLRHATDRAANQQVTMPAPALFDEIRMYIAGAFDRNLTIQSICEKFKISPTYVSKLFRTHGGTTFTGFLTGCRIDAAERLIRLDPRTPVKQVGHLVGFKDEYYFSRVFKQVTGRSPSAVAKHDNLPT